MLYNYIVDDCHLEHKSKALILAISLAMIGSVGLLLQMLVLEIMHHKAYQAMLMKMTMNGSKWCGSIRACHWDLWWVFGLFYSNHILIFLLWPLILVARINLTWSFHYSKTPKNKYLDRNVSLTHLCWKIFIWANINWIICICKNGLMDSLFYNEPN